MEINSMGLLSHIKKLLAEPKQPVVPREAIVRHTYTVLKNNGVTCRCNSLAIPTKKIGKIYRCVKCKRQFANAHYNLNVHIDNEYYDEAVDLISRLDS